MTRSELQNVLCDRFPLDKYETFVDCMLARLEAITDALTDDKLIERTAIELVACSTCGGQGVYVEPVMDIDGDGKPYEHISRREVQCDCGGNVEHAMHVIRTDRAAILATIKEGAT